ncbi:hypothetical protein [Aeropyrum camini]|uniref:Uncharacterized protein n=1 Tax=Aeropyrum camini SY1 = JCM 12091 TaxID=1198449 RepID=U3TEH0_9CREN|nr:hypothetical protein [Aeropyrum camini]BAN90841.1 hypothetical protein ACAM_1372 [Aeropyrum camini SY1 = JCM 12091]
MPEKGVVEIVVDLGKYKYIELEASEAERLLKEVTRRLGFESQDASETYRIIRNFDAFYDMAKKKFKDYIVPSKSMNDMILGKVIVDKVKLVKEGDKRIVGIHFDRRINEETLAEILRSMGYEVAIKRLEIA